MVRFDNFSILQRIDLYYIQIFCFFKKSVEKNIFFFLRLAISNQYQMQELLVDEWPTSVLVLVNGTRAY